MTGPEHYEAAERFLEASSKLLERDADRDSPISGYALSRHALDEALVHATLALTAVCVLPSLDLGPGTWRGDWIKTISRQPEDADTP